ncbi:MAG: hypothetical protein A3J76_03620 [Candidatus Moranbacteria bacterium RBG_13_45_13]|nr:MAG: hypothetical protein A3J76_03620 [Candidatus Moranbacteria bacterium RBG_13_45_13]
MVILVSAKILPFVKPQELAPTDGGSEIEAPKDSSCNSTLNEEWPKIVDLDWRNKIITQHAPLIRYIAIRLAQCLPPHIYLDDLISAGIIGLIDAIHKFDPGKGIEFKTYAEFRIKGTIQDELRSLDWIPRSVRKKQHLLEQTYKKLQKTLGRPAEPEEVVEALGIGMEEFYELLNETKTLSFIGIDRFWKALPDDESNSNKDGFCEIVNHHNNENPYQASSFSQTQEIVKQCIKKLPYGMRLLLSLYLYEDLTMKEISLLTGHSESRISQLFTEVLEAIGPELANEFGIPNFSRAVVNIGRYRGSHKGCKTLPVLLETLTWQPEKPEDEELLKKNVPWRWKNFAKKILQLCKGDDLMKNQDSLFVFFAYTTVQTLQRAGIETMSALTELTSDQFINQVKSLSRHAVTVRAIAENLRKKKLKFSDGEEATRRLESYHPKSYEPFVPESAAAPESLSLEAQPPASESVPPTDAGKGSFHLFKETCKKAARDLIENDTDQEDISAKIKFKADNNREYFLLINITPA